MFSLGRKIVLLLVMFVLSLSGLAIVVGYNVVDRMNERHYLDKANEVAATIARVVDSEACERLCDRVLEIYRGVDEVVGSEEWGSPEFYEYLDNYKELEETDDYRTILESLRRLQEVNDVDCFYLALVEPHDESFVYVVDAALEDACPIGTVDPLFDMNRRVLDDPMIGFPAYITDLPEYGWLVTSGAPVLSAEGEVICFALDDISMDAIKQQQSNYIFRLTGGLLGLTALLSILSVLIIRRTVVVPLNKLSNAAVSYCDAEGDRSTFKDLDIRTHDEIESLYQSMIKMEDDIDSYIENLVDTEARLRDTELRADTMDGLAHTDALTGLYNKLAYDNHTQVIEERLARGETEPFGIAICDLNDLKVVNDVYGHGAGDLLLKNLSNIITSVFANSSTYRIGGDEFAVVVEGEDLARSDELVAAFKAKVEALAADDTLRPWEKVSCAIGFARFVPVSDTGVKDVFRRADKQMYACKMQMKGGEAPR